MLKYYLGTLAVSYLVLVRVLQYRRLRWLLKKYRNIKELSPITAQKISKVPICYETPFAMQLGVQVALFKTYGIVSNSEFILVSQLPAD